MVRFSVAAAIVATVLVASQQQQVEAFAPQSTAASSSSSTRLAAKSNFQSMASAAFAGAVVMANVLGGADAAFAAMDAQQFDESTFGSSQLLAGRSGGRSGGRVSRGTSNSYKARAPPAPTRTIERTTVIQAAPSYASPVYMAPPVYNPGLGLGLGLSAVNDIGNTMRDIRQEGEIRQGQQELQQAKMKEIELEARIRQLEAASAAR